MKVFYRFFSKDLDLNYVDRFITTINSNISRGFPILLLSRSGLYIGPRTILAVSRFLKARDFRGYLDSMKSIAYIPHFSTPYFFIFTAAA